MNNKQSTSTLTSTATATSSSSLSPNTIASSLEVPLPAVPGREGERIQPGQEATQSFAASVSRTTARVLAFYFKNPMKMFRPAVIEVGFYYDLRGFMRI